MTCVLHIYSYIRHSFLSMLMCTHSSHFDRGSGCTRNNHPWDCCCLKNRAHLHQWWFNHDITANDHIFNSIWPDHFRWLIHKWKHAPQQLKSQPCLMRRCPKRYFRTVSRTIRLSTSVLQQHIRRAAHPSTHHYSYLPWMHFVTCRFLPAQDTLRWFHTCDHVNNDTP